MPQPLTTLLRRALLDAGAASLALPALDIACAAEPARLEHVIIFTNPCQVTGVVAPPDVPVFVTFPRWEENVVISVAEMGRNGVLTPCPSSVSCASRAPPATRKATFG